MSNYGHLKHALKTNEPETQRQVASGSNGAYLSNRGGQRHNHRGRGRGGNQNADRSTGNGRGRGIGAGAGAGTVQDQTLQSPAYLSALGSLVIPFPQLEAHNYPTADLTVEELRNRRRCVGCGKFWHKVRRNQERLLKQEDQERLAADARKLSIQPASINHQQDVSKVSNSKGKDSKDNKAKEVLNCKFHSGTLQKQTVVKPSAIQINNNQQQSYTKLWSCCNKSPSSEPCSGSKHHVVLHEDTQQLSRQWQLYPTPQTSTDYRSSYKLAVAIDCEMGVSKAGDSELIRLTMIDYFSSEVLIDRLVYPSVPMAHLNTRFSGVTWDMMNRALAKKQCIHGRDAARREVWRFVGPETIVIAHSGCNDLASLRWRHGRIIDTFSIEDVKDRARRRAEKEAKEAEEKRKKEQHQHQQQQAPINEEEHSAKEAVCLPGELPNDSEGEGQAEDSQQGQGDGSGGTTDTAATPKPRRVKGSGPFSLKTLARIRLGREIQTGKMGHDSLEDALAARDLADWLVRQILNGATDGEQGAS